MPDGAIKQQIFSSEERTQQENLPAALAFASGSACTQAIISSLVPSGGHIVSVSDVYGGSYRYMTKVAINSNIRTTFLEMSAKEDLYDLQEYQTALESQIEAAFQPETKVSAPG